MRLTDKPKSLSEMKPDTTWSPRVLAVMEKALERDARNRYKNASEFGSDLYIAIEQMPKTAPADAGTMVLGAATVAMAAPPPTRVARASSSAAVPPSEGATPAKPVPGIPATRSRAPLFAGGGVVLALAIAGAVFLSKGGGAAANVADPSKNATQGTAPSLTAPQTAGGTQQVAGNKGAAPTPGAARPGANPPVAPTVGSGAAPAGNPAGGAPAVSYFSELDALDNQIQTPETAREVLARLPEFRGKVTSTADKAFFALVEGKATVLTNAPKGCAILNGVKRADLDANQRKDLDEGLQACK